MKVTNYSFNDVDNPEKWEPEDPYNFEEWVTVTVGDENGGSDFQLHVCTAMSISGISDKTHVFMIDRWLGTSDLIGRLDLFIHEVEANSLENIYHELSKHWYWEYSGM